MSETRLRSLLDRLGVVVEDRAKQERLWGHCPFHDDVHASWFIRMTGERYGQNHCFACKAGGSLADLVMHVRRCTFVEACRFLHGFAPMPLAPETFSYAVHVRKGPSLMLEDVGAPPIVWEPLQTWVTPARRYLERRGITADQVKRWRIGYAVDGRLAGRVVIPVWEYSEPQRRLFLRSYHARTFVDSERRYLYPSSGEHANLDVLFGEMFWPRDCEARRRTHVVACEGAFNALAVERAAGGYVAALGGSGVRPGQIAKLATFGRVDVFTDADTAGDRVAGDLMAALLRRGVSVRRLRLKGGGDIDELSSQALSSALV